MAEYEAAMREALPYISETPGFVELEVRACLETPGRYLLLVRWETLEAHMIGFRQTTRYQKWRALLHGFYSPMPRVEHFGHPVITA